MIIYVLCRHKYPQSTEMQLMVEMNKNNISKVSYIQLMQVQKTH